MSTIELARIAATVNALCGDEPGDYTEPEYTISQIPPTWRNAAYLATANLQDDPYHNRIATAAHTILAQHCTPSCQGVCWMYRVQYAGGATLWQCGTGAVIVYPEN